MKTFTRGVTIVAVATVLVLTSRASYAYLTNPLGTPDMQYQSLQQVTLPSLQSVKSVVNTIPTNPSSFSLTQFFNLSNAVTTSDLGSAAKAVGVLVLNVFLVTISVIGQILQVAINLFHK